MSGLWEKCTEMVWQRRKFSEFSKEFSMEIGKRQSMSQPSSVYCESPGHSRGVYLQLSLRYPIYSWLSLHGWIYQTFREEITIVKVMLWIKKKKGKQKRLRLYRYLGNGHVWYTEKDLVETPYSETSIKPGLSGGTKGWQASCGWCTRIVSC